jgi:predicted transcriptional regulator
MSKTAPLSFRLDPDLKQRLQDLALADRRSLTNYIELVLEQHALEQTHKPQISTRRLEHAPF